MSKPTPGPYTVHESPHGAEITDASGVGIAWFGPSRYQQGREISVEEARANARAWVEGRDAAEKLERIRAVVAGYDADKFSDAAAFFQIKDILDEAKL